jgi:hypothetical protein
MSHKSENGNWGNIPRIWKLGKCYWAWPEQSTDP